MKPPKPRISLPRLVWQFQRGQWRPYHRVSWTEGGKKRFRSVYLDWKGDKEELTRLYWMAQTGTHEKQAAPARYTWRACIEAWRQDPQVQAKLADSTKKSYRRTMDAIMAKNGGKDMRKTTRQAIRAAIGGIAAETPRKATKYAQTISLLWNYAETELDWPMGPNPAKKLGAHTPAREYEPWPDWMVAKLDTAPERVQITARLILGTGQRPNAAIMMRHDQFQGEWMIVRDEKGKQELEVYCPERLRTFIEALPCQGQYVLAKNLTEPLGYHSVERSFRTWRNSMGDRAKPYSLHGLRKLAIIELAEAGASDAEIQAVTGQSADMVAYYRKRASNRALSMAAQKRRK
ncbi:phage integrase family protein [Roseovarius halotolerans]|uniref:Phage integrase family protein n=1 Tax=Roseovarius halotolerans TaxID=505353 RepID=A0A1X6Z8D2_9RHOB|nr:tyrosine-type recombinase/integrase [Roseovarius halotolerans]RKT30339.1 phage integrase family protein [Roseovarius halotolerans]SLN43176.1 Phage integrase family protein [Roseovarius halotolerans]